MTTAANSRMGQLAAELADLSKLEIRDVLVGDPVVTASEASLVYTFEPVVTATASWVLLGEMLSRGQWVGAVAIMAAVGWPRRSPPTPRGRGARR